VWISGWVILALSRSEIGSWIGFVRNGFRPLAA